MHFSAVTAALTLLSSASAIKVLSPHDGSVWSSGSSSQSITWEAVSTDPETFQVQLVNQVHSHLHLWKVCKYKLTI